jgi:outer membrane protein assembly complex protein YaeT
MAGVFKMNRRRANPPGSERGVHAASMHALHSASVLYSIPTDDRLAKRRERRAPPPFNYIATPRAYPVILCALIFLCLPSALAATQTNAPPRAKLKITGYGILGNRELKRILKTVELGNRKPAFYGATFVEDSALILSSRVKHDGFLKPKVFAYLTLEHGGHMRVEANELLENPLPRPIRFTVVHFKIEKGILYHYENLEFEGLQTIKEKEARSYFIETGTLLNLKRYRIYTPEKLKRGLSNLEEVFDRQGFQDAKAKASTPILDDKTGAVTVRVTVQQGLRSIVQSVREDFYYEKETSPKESKTVFPHRPYSKVWQQDFMQSLKTNQFHRGYPDTTIELDRLHSTNQNGRILIDFLAKIKSGPQIHIGVVDFRGEKKTSERVMARRVRVKRGELLDRIKVEEGRYRLAQLGSFETVDLTYQPVDEHTRDVNYTVKEGKTLDVNLLAGWGSYELLRGGFEIEQFNIWGLAHHAKLKAVQSFKASSGEFTYTMPEIVGHDVDLFFNGNALRREEVDFTRVEYGGGFGGHKYFKPYSTDATLRYNYQILDASDVPGIAASTGPTNTAVGAVILDLKLDRRDNPLYPRKGYKVFLNVELASEYLGGDVDYQRINLSTSWHHRIGGGRLVSLGFSHGVDLTVGSSSTDLPFNRRYFPGGENSIRGFSEGKASPRNDKGQIIGAETYSLATVELEQALTPQWSLVVFSDNLGFAEKVQNYPFDTGLFSVGGGLRWKTIIGPIRVEYGYNLNPRPKDPTGTLLFSLGFPF